MRTKAKKMGTRIINKIHVVDLLTQDNHVVGAAGFNIVDSQFFTINAKATILANGSCGYKVRLFWSAGTGDGIAAAYRAGAEMNGDKSESEITEGKRDGDKITFVWVYNNDVQMSSTGKLAGDELKLIRQAGTYGTEEAVATHIRAGKKK